MPSSSLALVRTWVALAPTSSGQVNVMSVLPEERDTFCSTMSMLISASATRRKILAA